MTQAREVLTMTEAPCPNTNINISFHKSHKPKPEGRGVDMKHCYPYSTFPEVKLWWVERLNWFQTNEKETASGSRIFQVYIKQNSLDHSRVISVYQDLM